MQTDVFYGYESCIHRPTQLQLGLGNVSRAKSLNFTEPADYEGIEILRGSRVKCIRDGMALWHHPTSVARITRAENTDLESSDPKCMCLP